MADLVAWNREWDIWHDGHAGPSDREPWLRKGYALAERLRDELATHGVALTPAFEAAWPG
jgi:hypothetical protein